MKYFSLLSLQEIHPLPGQKVVPAKAFETLLEASHLRERVQEEAVQFKKETVREAEGIKEAAFQEGFQEGLVSLHAHLFALDRELQVLREEIQKKILPLALKAARKIIGEELRLHPDRIVEIVLHSLKPVTQHKKIVIYVHKQDLEALETGKPKIRKLFEHLESLSIQERSDVEPGGCIIETEAGIINAQLENQWRALESAFEAFMKK